MTEIKTGFHLERVNGQNYAINIPYRASQGEIVPLIVLLHWAGKKYKWMGRGILEDLGLPALSQMQAILVAPDRRRRDWAKPKAIEDIAKLVDTMDARYNLDPQKRAVVGFSLGAFGVWYLMLKQPDLFPCGVAISAPVPDHITPKDLKTPTYVINSELDEHFPFETNQKIAQTLIEGGAPLEFHSVPYAAHTDVRDFIPELTRSIDWMEKVWAPK